jgi:autotransporter passenger strand-loop-strand repeat protein
MVTLTSGLDYLAVENPPVTVFFIAANDSSTLSKATAEGWTIVPQISGGWAAVTPTSVDGTVVQGGTLLVSAGGLATSTTVNSRGGGEAVFAGGTTISTTITSGALAVFSGGAASNSVISSGGAEEVFSGGTASNSVINSGGFEFVGGVETGAIISGGTLEVASGGSLSGTVTFAGSGGTLVIDGKTMPTNVISGLAPGDKIDLAGVSFASGGAAYLVSGTNQLEVSAGGKKYDLNLDPSESFSNESFQLSSHGSGTEITVQSGLSINFSYDPSLVHAGGASTIEAELTAAAKFFEKTFTNPVTLNISAGWGEENGKPVTGGGKSQEGRASVYQGGQIISQLSSTAQSPNQKQADGYLTSGNPPSNGNFEIGIADAKALKLVSGDSEYFDPVDGWIGFGTSGWSFSGGQEDFIDTAEHEISEVMGRDAFLNAPSFPYFSTMDLFRYTSSGVRDLTTIPPANGRAYFSINGGVTRLGRWNTIASRGDLGDWLNGLGPTPNDPFNYQATSGSAPVSPTDVTLMSVLGWNVSGYLFTNNVVNSGSPEVVLSGGTSLNTTVASGGIETVAAGGVSSDTTVTSGGRLVVRGTADPTTILTGGTEVISVGGIDDGALISGGRQLDFGVASGATIFTGSQVIEAGGTASDTTVSSGGAETVLSGGTAIGTTIVAGGTVTVSSGGTFEFTSGTTGMPVVRAGATLEVGSGYVFSGSVGSGVKLEILSGGADNGATVSSGGREIVFAGGTARATVLKGTEIVSSGGTTVGTTVSSGGTEIVSAGGTDSGTTVSSGGREIVSAHGTDDGAQISGGRQLDFGVASGATVFSGSQVVEAGGTASNTTVSSGGELLVSSGGIATNATIDAGAMAVIASGGILETTIGGTAIISGTVNNSGVLFASGSGSLLEIASGGVVNGGVAKVGNGIVDIEGASKENVRFVASGTGGLDLGDPTAYAGMVAGFGGSGHSNANQFIDLTGVTFSSGVVSETYSGNSTSGVLTVTSGSTTVASIHLAGSYVTSDFHLAAGSGGNGTIITDPQGGQGSLTIAGGSVLDINPATQVALLSQYMASFFPAGGAIQQTSLLSDVHAPPTPLLTTPGHA